jgi:DNA (cytosine-5)-methyltransferase 1
MKKFTHGSLFSGIGGFDLAAEWMGWKNKFHCEWNPFGQKVLKYYWPEAESFTDITKTDFTKYANKIDILTGGFPCQPYSNAGKRLGKADERHLWPEMLRAIREIEPTYIVGENVRGLLNWNGGMVFDEVCTELENIGYQVAPCIIPACAVGAPHRRERIWFIAYANSDGQHERNGINEINTSEGGPNAQRNIKQGVGNGFVTNADSIGQKRRMHANESETAKRQISKPNAWDNKCNTWNNFPTQSPICDGNDGISDRLDGITFSKWRNESIKAGGNAIVPQVAYQIFKAIEKLHV